MFGVGSIYQYFNIFWLIGAVLPCIFYAIFKYGGRFSWIGRTLHAPIMLGAMGWLPPATPLSFWTWGIFALLFNHVIKKRFYGWWSTYNYITAAALDAGLVISTIVIFFAITLPGVTIPQWWGNVDVFENMVRSRPAALQDTHTGSSMLIIQIRTLNIQRSSKPWVRERFSDRRRGKNSGLGVCIPLISSQPARTIPQVCANAIVIGLMFGNKSEVFAPNLFRVPQQHRLTLT